MNEEFHNSTVEQMPPFVGMPAGEQLSDPVLLPVSHKKNSGRQLVAVVLCCAILGGVIGAVLTGYLCGGGNHIPADREQWAFLDACQPGDVLTVTAYRQGQPLELTLTVTEKTQPAPADENRFHSPSDYLP